MTRYLTARRRAFTLIELMIVVAILAILTPSIFAFIAAIESTNDRTGAHINASERAAATIVRWRADVALASRLEIGDDGHSMTIHRRSDDGQPLIVRYAVLEEERLVRETVSGGDGAPDEQLAELAADLAFETVDGGYRLSWATLYRNGIQTQTWRHAAFATPLL